MQLLVNLHEDELRTYHGEGYGTVRRTRGAALSGAHTEPFGIDTAEQRAVVGVTFRPGGAFPFFAPGAGAIGGAHVELDALWGGEGAQLRERLLEATTPGAILRTLEEVLLARAVRPLAPTVVTAAVAALEADVPVAEVTARAGMSSKRFIRRFVEQVGLRPKQFACVRRFQRVLAALQRGRTVNWADVALACGYCDQAHRIHDFQAFSGVSPTAYRPRPGGHPNHVPAPL